MESKTTTQSSYSLVSTHLKRFGFKNSDEVDRDNLLLKGHNLDGPYMDQSLRTQVAKLLIIPLSTWKDLNRNALKRQNPTTQTIVQERVTLNRYQNVHLTWQVSRRNLIVYIKISYQLKHTNSNSDRSQPQKITILNLRKLTHIQLKGMLNGRCFLLIKDETAGAWQRQSQSTKLST